MTSRFLHSMYNKFKTIIRYSFCDIQNNQGLVKVYQPLSLRLGLKTAYSTLIFLDITKTKSNNIIVNSWIALA